MKGLFEISNPGAGPNLPESINLPTLSSFVRFLQRTVGANVLSTPQVIALDHQEAKVAITEEIPQVGESVTPTVGLSNINRITSAKSADVVTELKFTPHINPSVNSIHMQISQKIDNVIKTTNVPSALQDTNVAIRKREINTQITLKDKETAVLGGLVTETHTKTDAKIPLLGDLPLIGWLFKNSETERKKSILIVFVTPYIIHSAEEHKNILSSKLKERMDFIRNFTGNEDPYKELTQEMLNEAGGVSPEERYYNEEEPYNGENAANLGDSETEHGDTQEEYGDQESGVSESPEKPKDDYYNDHLDQENQPADPYQDIQKTDEGEAGNMGESSEESEEREEESEESSEESEEREEESEESSEESEEREEESEEREGESADVGTGVESEETAGEPADVGTGVESEETAGEPVDVGTGVESTSEEISPLEEEIIMSGEDDSGDNP